MKGTCVSVLGNRQKYKGSRAKKDKNSTNTVGFQVQACEAKGWNLSCMRKGEYGVSGRHYREGGRNAKLTGNAYTCKNGTQLCSVIFQMNTNKDICI